MGRRPGRSSAPFKRSLLRRDCHLRRRAPAARATGPAPPLSSQRAVRRYCNLASFHRRRVCPLSHRAPATCWAGPAPQLRYRRLPSWSGCSPRRFRSTLWRSLYLLSPPFPPPLLPPRPGTGGCGSAPQSGCAGSQQGVEGQRGRRGGSSSYPCGGGCTSYPPPFPPPQYSPLDRNGGGRIGSAVRLRWVAARGGRPEGAVPARCSWWRRTRLKALELYPVLFSCLRHVDGLALSGRPGEKDWKLIRHKLDIN